jgi:hypothetical protein
MEKTNIEAVLSKVKKLLAMATDSRGNANECANAAKMAAALMSKYQLENVDLIINDLNNADSMDKYSINVGKRFNTGLSALALAVSKYCDVAISLRRMASGDSTLSFFGYKSDVQMAQWLYEYLTNSANRLKAQYKETQGVGQTKAVNSFFFGVIFGIISNLKKPVVQSDKSSTSLVVAKAAAIRKFFGTDGSKSKVSSNITTGSFNAGVVAGKSVDVNVRGVNSNGNSGVLQLGVRA